MNEMPPQQNQEELKRLQKEKEENEIYEAYMAENPDIVIAPEDRREYEPEIAEFEEMLASFEATHSLEELHSITNLTPADAPNHPIREPARIALIPILEKLNSMENETNIPEETLKELKEKYDILSRAVGYIINNAVKHSK